MENIVSENEYILPILEQALWLAERSYVDW